MINEHDIVKLTRPVPEHGLEPGDVGTVVMVHASPPGFTVEFMDFLGNTLAIVGLPADGVGPVGPREVAHVRPVA
jgi:hypothetical protein